MYNATIGFLKRNMKIGMRLNPNTGLREDLPEYPIDALREAISNLLLHRDLSHYKESVYSKVIMYKDRIVFRNVGSLYGNNTIENIKNSEYNVEVRNETLVRLIETLGGVIENRHTGIKTMIDEMKEANLPEPIFNNERDDFVVTFYNGEYPELYPEELKKYKKIQETTQEKFKILNENQINIIKLIKENPSITQNDIAKKLKISRDGVKYNMNVLKKLNIIKREGSTKKGNWLILK